MFPLLVDHAVPLQFTNLGKPQLPWATLLPTLHERHLDLDGWPEDVLLPGSLDYNPKGIEKLSAEDMRRVYMALPDIGFRVYHKGKGKGKGKARSQEGDWEEVRPPAKKAKTVAISEKKSLHEIQTVAFKLTKP